LSATKFRGVKTPLLAPSDERTLAPVSNCNYTRENALSKINPSWALLGKSTGAHPGGRRIRTGPPLAFRVMP
jgi:hypothetical protein